MKQEAPIITLLTDFGLQDEYVGVMKGVVLSINSRVHLVDITHEVARHNIMHGALVIKAAYRYFPKGSIHVIVVDPGVGGKRDVICVKKEGHLFLAPDNGVLTLVIQDGKVHDIRAVTNEAYFLKPVSNTFHGRDIFAPIAAHLAKGVEMDSLGQRINVSRAITLDIPTPSISAAHELVGEIISIDHFGNLITNIDEETLRGFLGAQGREKVIISLAEFKIQGISASYDSVEIGTPLAVLGSRGLLEIVVTQQSARTYFGASIGQTVSLQSVAKKR